MKNILNLLITMGTLLLVTATTVLYSGGWRIGVNEETGKAQPIVKKTGMLAVRSIPEPAKVYLDGEAVTATDDTIPSLNPGRYNLKIEKEGFETWEKDVDVFPELVTDITSVLVLQSPRLEPLTNTDVNAFDISPNQNNIAFLTKNHDEPGIWLLPLTGPALNIFRNETRVLVPDTLSLSPSLGEELWWSPNGKELLVKMNETGYLLYEINLQNNSVSLSTSLTNVKQVFQRWDDEWRTEFLPAKIRSLEDIKNVPADTINVLEENNVVWSPDEEKFFFFTDDAENPNDKVLNVYNLESPLPIGEKRSYQTLKFSNTENTKFYWYSDSYHLIIVEKSPDGANHTVSLIRIDGTNRTPVYTGLLASEKAYPSPSGDKIIVRTSLKDFSQTNLYAIAIR